MAYEPRTYELKSRIARPRAQVWELLSNTDRLNKAVGLSPVEFDPKPTGGSAAVREARAKFAGLVPMRWKEYPFQWVKNERYSVLRVYDEGPVARFLGGVELADAPDNGTDLRLFSDFTAANALGSALIPLIAQRMLRKTLAVCNAVVNESHATREKIEFSSFPDSPTDALVLQQATAKLQQAPVAANYVQRLVEHLQGAGDDEVTSMQPYRLAEKWGMEKNEVLRAFLHGTKAGLMNLSWSLMCPNCRVPVNQIQTLGKLTEHIHCDFCGVMYDADFDRYVELRFNVQPGIRNAVARTYCIGGPFMAPHVLAQQSLPCEAEVALTYPTFDGELRVRVLRSPHHLQFLPGAATTKLKETEVAYTDEGWLPDHIAEPSPGDILHFINRSSGDIVFDLEKMEWDPYAVTALKVTAMQEFRDMFSSEVLAPGHHIGVESLTLFFSDLRGSTDMYEKIGDASAYNRVRKHFDYLFDAIGMNNGCTVKTIGDAVMAVFHTPVDALRASLAIQRDIAQFNSELPEGIELSIKIGLHHGPAICVNSNDKIDYFGRTVNIAARTTGQCHGGDIVMSEEVYGFAGVRQLVEDSDIRTDRFEACLKGIEGDCPLYRVTVDMSPSS